MFGNVVTDYNFKTNDQNDLQKTETQLYSQKHNTDEL